MKKFLSFFAAILFAGSMMATDVEVIIHASSGDYYAKTQSWTNGTQYDQVVLDEVITANRIGTTNNGKYYSDWRFYTNGSDNGSFSIDAAEGYELQSATLTYTVSNSGALYFGEAQMTSNTPVELSGSQAVFQCKNTNTSTNGQVRLTKIAVTYAAAQGGGEPVEPQIKTLYCKVAQDWWKADGAAVGVYAFGEGGVNNAAWPGVRMEAVDGETDIWKADVDLANYPNVIFTRVNASGDIADWGAKTADLLVPADKDLYTVTSASAVWGDPGVEGEWSVYSAQPQPTAAVALPATLDVNNVSFRSEGMPDFVLEEGDYAGTYFDMGAHDSANDTLLYAQWDVTIEPIMYTVGVVVYNTNSWRVQLDLLNQADEVVKAIRYKGSSGQCGQYGIGTLDLTDLAAGNYKVRVHAATAWSAMKLKDVIFVANYAGVNVDLPGTLLPAYAELSTGATVSNNAIAFAPSTANNEYAIWNVSFAEAGNFNVTIDMTAPNGHTYGVALISADGATEIAAVAEVQAWDTGVKELGAIEVPAAGNYKVKLTNATQWSEAVINSITFAAAPATPTLENGFYLVGSINGWAPAAEYHLVGNPDNNAEFMVNVTLAENDELKVVNVLNDEITAWFPGGDNYVVDAAHAGEKTVYFRPDYQGGEDWFGACIYIAPNAEPQPASPYIFEWTKGTGAKIETDNTDLNANDMGAMTVGTSVVARLLGSNAVDNNAKGYKLGNNDVCVEIQGTRAFVAGDTVVITGVCGGSGARAFAIAPITTVNAVVDTALTNTQENTSDILEYKVVVKEAQAGEKMRIFRLAGKTMYLYSVKVLPYAAPAEDPAKFYITGDAATVGESLAWNPAAIKSTEDAYTLALAAGDFKLKVTTDGTWNTAKGFSDLTSAADGLSADGDGNICFTLAEAGDVVVTYTAEAFTLAGNFYVEPEPQGCNWDAIDFLGDGSPEQTFGNQFKICKEGEVPGVVNIQKPGFADESGIYVTFPSAEFGAISLAEGQYAIQGAGMVLYCSAFTALETEVSIVCQGNTYTFTIYNANGGTPQPAHTYTVAGSSDVAFGTAWAPANTANDMEMNDDGIYVWEKAELTLAAGVIEFKVCEDHAWTNCWPSSNYQLNIPEAGIYTIWIHFDPANGNQVTAEATKTGSAVVLPTIAMHGNFLGSWADTQNFTVAEGDATASLTLNIAAGNYEFGMRIGGSGNWTANGAAFTRENASHVIEAGQGNLTLAADEAGEYTFTWTFATNTLAITFPDGGEPYVPVHADGYYLVGSFNEWTPAEAYMFAPNEGAEGEYQLAVTLTEGAELKVVKSESDILTWYGANNYVVPAEFGREVIIYFRPEANQEWSALDGHIYIAIDPQTGINNTEDGIKAVKVLRDGQILIMKGDKTYNVMGAIVR